MQHLKDYITESILSSVGAGKTAVIKKIVSDKDFSTKNIALLEKDVAVWKPKDKKELIDTINAYIKSAGPDCSLNWIDVSSIKDMSKLFYKLWFNGDIDIAIKLDNKKELSELIDKVFPNLEKNPNTTPSIVSISYPYNKEGKSGNAQVDFMIVKDIDFAKFFYHSPDFKKNESKFKGATRAKMLSIIVSCIPVEDAKDEYFEDGKTVKKHWKYTFNTEGVFRQLLDYTGKKGPLKNPKKVKEFEKLIANDPDNCIKFIFGDNGKIEDCNSAESLWKAVHDNNKFKFQDVVKKIEDRWFDEIEELKDKREFFENL